jgi:nitroimidazol reductase NimA-like FMN-containing flavoprotein (pyridoxamine 5'-phosphate oxidase superfamily)
MAITEKELLEYLKENKSVVLATAGADGQPDLRSLGGYNFDGFTLYFGSSATANKVKQIADNSKVSILVQHEGQVIPNFKNVTIYGVAQRLSGADYEEGKKIIKERRPNAEFDEAVKSIFRVIPGKIKALDFSAKPEEQLTVLEL